MEHMVVPAAEVIGELHLVEDLGREGHHDSLVARRAVPVSVRPGSTKRAYQFMVPARTATAGRGFPHSNVSTHRDGLIGGNGHGMKQREGGAMSVLVRVAESGEGPARRQVMEPQEVAPR